MSTPKKHRRDILWFILFGLVLAITVPLAPSLTVANAIVAAVFSGRESTESELNASMEEATYKFRGDYPSLNSRLEYAIPSGTNSLKAYYYAPATSNGSLLLMAHGMGSMSDGIESGFASYFLNHGYNVLQLDLTASGQSEGTSAGGLDQSALDVTAALSFIHSSSALKSFKLGLLGYSWGAYGCLASLHYDQAPLAVASLAGFESPDKEMIQYASRVVGMGLAKTTKPFMDNALYAQRGKAGFLRTTTAINGSSAKIFLAQGDQDRSVSYDYSAAYAYRNDITDQSRLTTYFKSGRTHTNLFLSEAAIAYNQDVVEPAQSAFNKTYGSWSKASLGAKQSYRLSIDKEKSSELNGELFTSLSTFFAQALA